MEEKSKEVPDSKEGLVAFIDNTATLDKENIKLLNGDTKEKKRKPIEDRTVEYKIL